MKPPQWHNRPLRFDWLHTGRVHSMRVQAAQVIDSPPADVFRFVATDHFQNHPKWDPAIETMTPTSPAPMAPGSTARLVRRDRGKTVEGTVTVTEYEPVRAFAVVTQFGPFTLHQRAVLEPICSQATRLNLTIDTQAKGSIRFLLPLFGRRFRKTMARSLLAIKQHTETQTPA
jgi:polyketide cyclase/dehydrase/lipid transport protein